MRQTVLEELNKRIEDLKKVAKPGDIATGMSGSFIRFNYHLQSHTAMTEDEFKNCTYDDWLREKHREVLKEVNKDIVV